jgi:hypothetical protein
MITAWLTVIALCCVIIAAAVLCLAALGVRTACCWVRDWWGRARDVIRLTQDEAALHEPVPYWPACPCPPGCRCPLSPPDDEMVSRIGTIVFCPACHPGGHGTCTCVAYCGDRQCAYGLGKFSAEEAAWLRGLGITEGTEQ